MSSRLEQGIQQQGVKKEGIDPGEETGDRTTALSAGGTVPGGRWTTAGRDTRYGFGLVQARAAYDRIRNYGCGV